MFDVWCRPPGGGLWESGEVGWILGFGGGVEGGGMCVGRGGLGRGGVEWGEVGGERRMLGLKETREYAGMGVL